MSWQAVQWAFGPLNTTPVETLVLVALCHHYAEDKKRSWPSHLLLVRETKLARSTVSEALASLERSGLIHRHVAKGTSTRYTLPKYTPQLHRLADELHRLADIKENRNSHQELTSKAAPSFASVQHGEAKMKVAQIQAKAENVYAGIDDAKLLAERSKSGHLTAAVMASQWRRWHGKYVDGFLPAIRVSEQGMFVQAAKRIGEQHTPAAILAVLKDWHGFTALTKDKAGAFNVPSLPQIPFFLRHAELALAFSQHTAATQVGKAKVQLTAQPQFSEISPSLDKPTLTVADIQDVVEAL